MQNKWVRFGFIGIGSLLALCIILNIGLFFVGPKLGRFPHRPFYPDIRLLTGSHGAIGQIQKIEGQTLTLQLRDGTTQSILIDNNTRLERNRQKIALSDLHVNDSIIVIGSSGTQGQIIARLIRVIDSKIYENRKTLKVSSVIPGSCQSGKNI